MIKVQVVNKFTNTNKARCQVSSKYDLSLQRRNMFFLTVMSMTFGNVEVIVNNQTKHAQLSLSKERMKYFYMEHSVNDPFEDIWDNFGLDIIRNSFFIGIPKKEVKRIFIHMKNNLIPALSSAEVKGLDQNTLELIEVLDSYKDYRFRDDVNTAIKSSSIALNKIIQSIL